MAFSQANRSWPVAGFGGVWGRVRLNAASASDAIPATRKMYRWAIDAAAPLSAVSLSPSALPNHVENPTSDIAGTLVQSTRMKMNGQEATIHPIVPHTRTGPNCRVGSLRLANAIEFVI